jgi:selenocysteine-specific elongation factor
VRPPDTADVKRSGRKLQIAPDEFRQLINLLIGQQKVVLIDRIFPFSSTVIVQAEEKLIQFLHTKSTATVSELKDVLGVSRKYAVPLLTYFDQKGVTIRSGDLRRLG